MNRLTLEERRQVFRARQRGRWATLDHVLAPSRPLVPASPPRWLPLIVKIAMLAALVGAGVLAAQTVTWEPPASVVQALLPPL